MSLGERVKNHVVEPTVLRLCQWRGDPVARLLLPATKADPYPLYARLRQRGLVRSPLGVFAAADHATVGSILRDRRFSSSPVHQRGYRPPSYPPGDPRAGLPAADLLTMDPPDHTRLRRLVAGAFTPRAIAGLEPWIRELTVRLLTAADGAAGFDLIDALAFPLPIAVICHLLGVPAEDQAQFRAWGHDVAATLDPQTAATVQAQTRAAELALTGYLQDLARERRANPDDSILSALIAAEEEGDRLSSGEVVSTALLLLIAGFETTVNLIGNGTVALLGDPDNWNRLRQDSALVPAAIEEMLRYDSPVQLTSRIATEDVEVGGSMIEAGRAIIVSIGGANRDPEVFEQPDEFRIDRPDPGRHLSFSLGIHHCLGAALARLEGRIAIEELTRRYPIARAGRPADPAPAARAARLRERSRPRHADAIAVRRLALAVRMGHRVDHRGGSQDQDVVLTRRYLDPVGVTDPEPPLGHLGDPPPVIFDRVLVVHDVALDPQVRATFDVHRPPFAHRCDHGLLDQGHPAPAWILDLHAVLDPQHALLDPAQLTAVDVLKHDRLANPQCLTIQPEHVLAAIVLDHIVIADGDHPLTHLIARHLRATPAGFPAFLAPLLAPVPAQHRLLPAIR